MVQLFRICGLYCQGSNSYHFAYFNVNSDFQIFDLITLNNCSNLYGYRTLGILYGNQNISNINISYNNNIQISGIYFENPNSMFSSHCTFYNNTVKDYSCIYLHG